MQFLKVFFSIFALKIMKSTLLSMLKPLLNLRSHNVLFINIFHNIGYEMRHRLWTQKSYSRLCQFSKCFFIIFALKIMKSPLLSMLEPLANLKSHKLVFLKIFHNIGYEMRHQLWIHSSYSRLYQFSKCFFSIFALKMMQNHLLSINHL